MIGRVVQMTFRPDAVEEFIALFNARKSKIRHFEGCNHLELWQDTNNANVYFTYSIWENEQMLNHYRFSDLFKDTWTKTKSLFSEKAKAWSVNKIMIVE